MNNIIEASHVSKQYSGHKALDDVSISIPQGSVYGLLGPNGAGKTTLIRIINHITAPDTGTVAFDGHPLCEADMAHIGYLPEERGLYKKMKVGEQAVFFARLKGMSRADATRELRQWFDRFGISDWWDRKVEELSKGMAQKVQFIVTVLHRPKLLIFDEPFSGFDPINANLLRDEILRLREEGSTVIFSTHNMASVEEICDHITLINRSRDILSGRVDDIRRRWSEGHYVITYTELEPTSMMEQLQPMAGSFTPAKDSRGRHTLDLRLKPGATLREVINVANRASTLVGINEAVASMNDIFISAVNSATQGVDRD
ncbi:MAG: ABC transporter ATP-binding protein [Pseudoflavonifractor sp.]|nr:ABC transporter ATP-binding protein [Alloprevotella sp.]MCM1116376.1 ABC transporter ATP-binding protein [Pseudoflavonifractor sp.]